MEIVKCLKEKLIKEKKLMEEKEKAVKEKLRKIMEHSIYWRAEIEINEYEKIYVFGDGDVSLIKEYCDEDGYVTEEERIEVTGIKLAQMKDLDKTLINKIIKDYEKEIEWVKSINDLFKENWGV